MTIDELLTYYVERYGNEHILPNSFIDKMEEDIKELSRRISRNPDDFEYSKENTDYIKLECISCNKPVVLPARFSDGHRCQFCNDHMRAVSYVRRKHDLGD